MLRALLAILAVYAAPAAEKTVYLKDFLAPGAAGTDAVPAVRAALEHCAEVGASRLVLPGGQLRMRPTGRSKSTSSSATTTRASSASRSTWWVCATSRSTATAPNCSSRASSRRSASKTVRTLRCAT